MADIRIIDDNSELQQVLTDYMESDSHSVVSANDGASAKQETDSTRMAYRKSELLRLLRPCALPLDLLPTTTPSP